MAGTKRKVQETVQTSKYIEGSIVRIKLENFLTYDSVEFSPGPNLNVIIGPNGTGKSSIVCAIALGLAAKPSVLGRAKDPQDFVKHGYNRGMVEIELYNSSGDNWVIRREIFKKQKDNSSKWSVNGRPATTRTVEETVARLNIQVGNLCQFLPQDKVAEFAKMTPQDLLENTEKAIGGQDMFDNHQILKKARETGRTLELNYKRCAEKLEKEIKTNERLEQDVKNFQEREHHLERIRILQMKRPWVEYEEKRKEYVEQKTKKENLEKEVKEAQKLNAPLRSKLEAATKQVQEVEGKKKKKDEEIRNHAKAAAAKAKDIEDLDETMNDCRQELVNKKREEDKRLNRLNDLQVAVDSLEVELSGLDTEDVQPEIDRVSTEMRDVNRNLARITQEGEQSRTQHGILKREVTGIQTNLRKLQDVNNMRLDMLRRRSKDAYDAVMWLREHENEFSTKIHEPIMTVINVTDPANAKYVETHIPNKEMFAFVCEDKEDMKKFLDELKEKQKLKISAVEMPPNPSTQYKPAKPIGHYRQFGFHSYLREMFTCPEAVMRYLCLQYHVHKIPVGNKHTKDTIESVITNCRELAQLYTENHKYTVKRSKYTGNISTSCIETKVPALLTATKDESLEKQLRQELQIKQDEYHSCEESYKVLQNKHKELEKQMNTLRTQKKELSDRKNARRVIQDKITMKKASITRLEGEGCDLAQEEEVTKSKMKAITEKKVRFLSDMKNHTKKCLVLSKEKVNLCIKTAQSVAEATKLEALLRDQSQHVKQVENDFVQAREKMKQTKEAARRLLLTAKSATNTKKDDELSQELRTAFETCPNTLEDIDSSIHEEQARADCTMPTNEDVVREYQKRKIEIGQLELEVQTLKGRLDNHQDEINETREKWYEPLKELLGRINEKFGMFFSQMQCAGEVDLKCPENSEDYEKYGVCIKVKFRDSEPLRELTSTYQSGGEKSVATVLYMMSLQELTHCPFRCVDEINQGMDPNNERKVFELVVKTACREGTSQYFLLTPKLLPDLSYGERMTIMCVFNGPHMMHHQEWNVKKFIRRRRQIVD